MCHLKALLGSVITSFLARVLLDWQIAFQVATVSVSAAYLDLIPRKTFPRSHETEYQGRSDAALFNWLAWPSLEWSSPPRPEAYTGAPRWCYICSIKPKVDKIGLRVSDHAVQS